MLQLTLPFGAPAGVGAGVVDLCCCRRLASSAGLDPFQSVVNSLQCEVSLINWPFQLQPVFLYKPRPSSASSLPQLVAFPLAHVQIKSQPRLLAASEGTIEAGLGSRSVSSAFLQCSCFLGFSQHVVGQPASSTSCLSCVLEQCEAGFVREGSAQSGRWC